MHLTPPPGARAAFPRILGAAPHRALFLAGAIQSVVGMLWWLLVLLAREQGGLGVGPLPEGAAHAWLMLQGLFPFFVFGFLFTALPNWVNGTRIPPRTYLACAALLSLGTLLVYAGMILPMLAVAGLVLHAAGWFLGLGHLGHVLLTSTHKDKRQPWLAWAATLLGGFGDLLQLVGLLDGSAVWFTRAETLAVWGFLTPLFLAVCHRMIPFFTSRVVANYVSIQPYGPLWIMVGASLGHGALASLDLARWTWLTDIPLAAIAFWFVSCWGIAASLRERLLAMLHIGFAWGALAFALHALDSLLGFLHPSWGLGLAPLHALGIGFFASMLLAMASRVTLGHSGQPLKADSLTWSLFWLAQVTALTRMLPDMIPGLPQQTVTLSAVLWLAAFGLWACQYMPFYWRPRADGKPG